MVNTFDTYYISFHCLGISSSFDIPKQKTTTTKTKSTSICTRFYHCTSINKATLSRGDVS